jgi:hypothetical protein
VFVFVCVLVCVFYGNSENVDLKHGENARTKFVYKQTHTFTYSENVHLSDNSIYDTKVMSLLPRLCTLIVSGKHMYSVVSFRFETR